MGQGRWFDSQLHNATTVLSIIFPKRTLWDTGTAHCVHFVPPHKSLVFPCSSFWICRGQILLPGTRAWTSTSSEAGRLHSALPFPAAGSRLLKVIQQDFSGNTQGWHECKCNAGEKVQTSMGTTTIKIWLPCFRACVKAWFGCWMGCLSVSAFGLWFQVWRLSGCWFSHSLCCSFYNNMTTNCSS